MPTLADCLKKSKLDTNTVRYLKRQAKEIGDPIAAVRAYAVVVDNNVAILSEAVKQLRESAATHKAALMDAISAGRPVSAEAADQYGVNPNGWALVEGKYIQPEVEVKPPKASVKPDKAKATAEPDTKPSEAVVVEAESEKEQEVQPYKRGDVVSAFGRDEAKVLIPDLGYLSWKKGNVRIKMTSGDNKGKTMDVEPSDIRPLSEEDTIAGKAAKAARDKADVERAEDEKIYNDMRDELLPLVRRIKKSGVILNPKTKKAKKELLDKVIMGTENRNEKMIQEAIDIVATEVGDQIAQEQTETLADEPIPEFTRTTPDKGSTTRQFQAERVATARGEIADLERKRRVKQGEYNKLRSNATKKRAAVTKEIEFLNRTIGKIQGEIASDLASDTKAKLEDEMESPRSYDHYLAGMKAIYRLKASVAEDAARRGEIGREAAREEFSKEEREADRFDAELQGRAKDIAKSQGFNSGDAEQIALSASNVFTVFEDRSLADVVKVHGKRTRESRVSQEINKLKPDSPYNRQRDLSDEQIESFTKQYQEASKDDKNWLAKRGDVDKAVKEAIKESRETVRQREDADRKEKEVEKAKEAQEALVNARERAKKYFLDERISKALKKQKPKTTSVKIRQESIGGPIKVVDGKTIDGDQKGELYLNGLILHKTLEKGRNDFQLTHARSGFAFPFSAKKSGLQELIGLLDILGVDFNVDTDASRRLPSDLVSRVKKINTAWDNDDYTTLSEKDYATVEALAEVPKTDIEADLILTADDLGANGIPPGLENVMTDSGVRVINEMAKAVPEFAYDPVFTFQDGKLVYQDGYKFEIEPTAFNLHPSELTEGQTVGINLEDMGIKRSTPHDVVADMLKHDGYSNVSRLKGSDITASVRGKKVSVIKGEQDNDWDVAGPRDVQDLVIATLKKIRWRQPGQTGDQTTDVNQGETGDTEEQKQTAEEKKLAEKINDIPDVLYQTDNVDDSIRMQTLDIAFAAEDAGIKTFDQLVAFSVKTVGERRTREIGAHLRLAGKAAGFAGVRKVGDVLGMPDVTREQAVAFAKAAFPMLSDEKIEAGIDIVERLGLLDNIGFAPSGSPVPDSGLAQGHLPSRVKLYRAANDDYVNSDSTSFSTSKDAAKAYLDNQGFGGTTLFETSVNINTDKVLDLFDSSDPVQTIVDTLDIKHPGAIGAEEWIPRITNKLTEHGIEWVRVKESFPEGSETWIHIGGVSDDPELTELFQNQKQDGNVKGWTSFITATRAIIGATATADVSTFIHEFAHPMRRFLLNREVPQNKRADITDNEILKLEKAVGVNNGVWEVENEEKFAKMWEQYWFEGKVPTNSGLESLFEKIARWMREVYKGIQQITGGKLPQEVRALFDKLVQRSGDGEIGDTMSQNEMPETASITTGTKYAKTEGQRTSVGDAPRERHGPRNVEERQQQAINELAANPGRPYEIIAQMNAKPSPLTDMEDALLNARIRELKNNGDIQGDDRQEWLDLNRTVQRGHSEWGYAGHAAQAELAPDFSVEGLTQEHVRYVGSDPTPEQLNKYAELAAKNEKLELDKQELVKKLAEEAIAREKAEAATSKPKPPQGKKGTKLSTLKAKADKAIESFKGMWGSLVKAGDTLFQSEDYDPDKSRNNILQAATEVVKAYVDMGVTSLVEFQVQMKNDGVELTDQQTKAFKEAWAAYQKNTKVESPIGKDPESAAIGARAKELMALAIEAGYGATPETWMEVVDVVHSQLSIEVPGTSEYDTMQAMSDYGIWRPLNKAEVAVKTRAIRGKVQQSLKIEDTLKAIEQSKAWLESGVSPEEVASRLQEQKLLPKATGSERATPDSIERDLISEFNKLKKTLPVSTESMEGQLKSAISTAKTAGRNRLEVLDKDIEALEEAIAKREAVVKPVDERTPLKPDEDLIAIRKQLETKRKRRDDLKAEYEKIFPPTMPKVGRKTLTDEQRLAMSERMLRAQIDAVNEDMKALKAGTWVPATKGTTPTSETKEALKAELSALEDIQEQARKASPAYQAREEAKYWERYRKSQEKRLAFWEKRRDEAEAGRLPVPLRKQTVTENAILDKNLEIEKVQYEAMHAIEKANRATWNAGQWIGHGLLETTSLIPKTLMLGLDLSYIERQGFFFRKNPIKFFQAVVESIPAVFSQRLALASMEDIESRPDAREYHLAGIDFTQLHGPKAKLEEMYQSAFVQWLTDTESKFLLPLRTWAKLYAALERGNRTFSNIMKADLYDIQKRDTLAAREFFRNLAASNNAVGKWLAGGNAISTEWTPNDIEQTGRISNIFSGRGTGLKGGNPWLDFLFLARRWTWSRIQTDFILPIQLMTPNSIGQWNADRGMRVALARLYIQTLLSHATKMAIGYWVYSLLAGDDEEKKPTIEWDPRSSDAWITKIGETRLKDEGGLMPAFVLAARIATGKIKTADGEIKSIYGEDVKWGGKNAEDYIIKFAKYKLGTGPSSILEWFSGRDAVGKVIAKKDDPLAVYKHIVTSRVTPLGLSEIVAAEKELGVKQGTMAALEAFLGVSVSTYGDRTEYRQGNEAERKKQFEKDLEQMKFNSPDPAYKGFLSKEQMVEVDERREDRKQGLVYAAAHNPIREDFKNDKTYNQAVKERDIAMENMKQSGMKLADAQSLLIKYWESNYKSAREIRDGEPVYKTALSDRLQQLIKVFQ